MRKAGKVERCEKEIGKKSNLPELKERDKIRKREPKEKEEFKEIWEHEQLDKLIPEPASHMQPQSNFLVQEQEELSFSEPML